MSTIKDVALDAGVSKSTVSKVLNNYPNLSPETIKRVNESIVRLGYVPNAVAASLSKKNFKKIGVIVKINNKRQAIDEINMQYLLGIDEVCAHNNYETSIIFSNAISEKNIEELIAFIKSKSITSLIIVGLSKDDEVLHELINRQVLPIVVTEAQIENPKTSNVGIDNYAAQYEIAKEIIGDNRNQKVLYLSGKGNGYVSEYRHAAMVDLAAELDLNIDYYQADFSELKAYRYICQCDKQYDTIICASDLMAIGVDRGCKEKEINPQIVGFDGITLLSYVSDQIPTVKQDFFQIAIRSVEEAISIQEGNKPSPIQIPYVIDCMHNENI